jgi:hypothetical protein
MPNTMEIRVKLWQTIDQHVNLFKGVSIRGFGEIMHVHHITSSFLNMDSMGYKIIDLKLANVTVPDNFKAEIEVNGEWIQFAECTVVMKKYTF